MMGQYEAKIPEDRRYFKSHMWLQPGPDLAHVGLTAYAVRLLQDVYFLDWSIDPETRVHAKQDIGQIESSKAVSTVYAPAAGHIHQFNAALLNDPSLINAENYQAGWLFEFDTTSETMSAAEYVDHLAATWETTQRLLKGQYNA